MAKWLFDKLAEKAAFVFDPSTQQLLNNTNEFRQWTTSGDGVGYSDDSKYLKFSANGNESFATFPVPLKPNTLYTLVADVRSNDVQGQDANDGVYLVNGDTGATPVYVQTLQTGIHKFTFTTGSSTVEEYKIGITATTTGNNLEVRPVLIEGDFTFLSEHHSKLIVDKVSFGAIQLVESSDGSAILGQGNGDGYIPPNDEGAEHYLSGDGTYKDLSNRIVNDAASQTIGGSLNVEGQLQSHSDGGVLEVVASRNYVDTAIEGVTGSTDANNANLQSQIDGINALLATDDTTLDEMQEVIDYIKVNKADLDTHSLDSQNPHAVTKAQVGLGMADNTSDMNKPVSTAQQAAIDAEAATRANADTNLQTQIDTEITNRTNEDNLIRTSLDGEIVNRQAAISDIAGVGRTGETVKGNADTIAANQATLQSAIDSEASSRNSADTYLQSQIDDLSAAKTTEDANLQSQIDDINTLLASDDTTLDEMQEVVNYIKTNKADMDAHSARVDNPHNVTTAQLGLDLVDNTRDMDKPISNATQTALTDEQVARQNAFADLQGMGRTTETVKGNADAIASAQATLQSNIDNETATRASEVSSLQTDLTSETTARQTADTGLQNQIDSEVSTRANAVTSLQGQIDSEVSTRTSEVASLNTAISTANTNRINADANLQTQIDDLTASKDSDVAGLQSQLDAEITNRTAADSDLAGVGRTTETIKANADAIAANHAELDSAIADEESARIFEIDRLDTLVADETAARNAAVDTLTTNLNQEISDRTAADLQLQSNIDSLTTTKDGEVSNLQTQIDDINTLLASDDTTLDEMQEVVDFVKTNKADMDAHSALQNNPHAVTKAQVGLEFADNTADLDKPISIATQTALDTESAARTNADTGLQNQIDAEVINRTNADNTLQSNIDSLSAAKDNDIADLAGAGRTTETIKANADAIANEINNRSTAISNEENARQAADSNLQTQLNNEAATRASEVASLNTAISNETSNRFNDVSALQTNIDNEEAARQAADSNLQTQLNTETSARTADVANLQTQIDGNDADIASLQGAGRTTETVKGNADAIAANYSSLNSAISTEATNRSNAVGNLQTQLDAEIAATDSEISTLTNDLATEVTNREAADTSLQSQIDGINELISSDDTSLDEMQEVVDYIKLNKADLDAHSARLDNPHQVTKAQVGLSLVDNTADMDKPVSTAVQTALDSEINSRTTGDTQLQANIDAEASARSAEDIRLQAEIDTKATDAPEDGRLYLRKDGQWTEYQPPKYAKWDGIGDDFTTEFTTTLRDPNLEIDLFNVFVGGAYAYDANYTLSLDGEYLKITFTNGFIPEVGARIRVETKVMGKRDVRTDISTLENQMKSVFVVSDIEPTPDTIDGVLVNRLWLDTGVTPNLLKYWDGNKWEYASNVYSGE